MIGQEIIDKYRERFVTPPYQHQVEDVATLVRAPIYGLFNEMGTGKTKTVIDAACILKSEGQIDMVVIVAPAAVRTVWVDPEMGEVKKHAWLPSCVIEFHAKTKITWSTPGEWQLDFCVTNYEFIRNSVRLNELIKILHNKRFMLVLDESSFIKNRSARQTKACIQLGKLAARKVILNGTPIANNPLDVWAQMQFLDKRILPYENYSHFRSEFAVLDQRVTTFPRIIGWKNIERLQAECAPYVVRREKKDCLDLPEKIYTQREVKLSDSTWKIYKTMRDEAIVFMEQNPTLATEAGVRVMRLGQITSGFLGGFEAEIGQLDQSPQTKVIGTEKLDDLREWVMELFDERPNRKILVWCRFRLEIERVAAFFSNIEITQLGVKIPTFRLYGQKKSERSEAVTYFSKVDDRPGLMAAQWQAGGFGLNLVGADTVACLSNDFNLMTRLQAEDRCHRVGQRNVVLYNDFLATGPNGQRTIDHHVLKMLHEKRDLAQWTVDAWKRVLED